MPYTAETIEVKENYIFLKAQGSYSGLENLPALMNELVELSTKNNIKKVIVDFRSVKGHFPTAEKFELGELAAKLWGFKLKVAFVYRAGEISGMFENVAVNRGGNLRVVTSLEEAYTWLENPDI